MLQYRALSSYSVGTLQKVQFSHCLTLSIPSIPCLQIFCTARQGQDVDEASGSRVDHRDTLRHPPRLRDRRGQGGRRAWVPAEIPPVPLRAPVAVHGSPSHEHRYAELQDILLMSVLGRLCSEMRFLGCYRDNGSAVRCWGRGVLDRLPVDAPGCRHGAHALVHCVHVTRVMSPYIHPAESTRQLLSCDSI